MILDNCSKSMAVWQCTLLHSLRRWCMPSHNPRWRSGQQSIYIFSKDMAFSVLILVIGRNVTPQFKFVPGSFMWRVHILNYEFNVAARWRFVKTWQVLDIVENIHKTASLRWRKGHSPRIWGIIGAETNFECKSKFRSNDEYKRVLAVHRRHGENRLQHLHRISDASSHEYGVNFFRWCGKVYNQLLENLEIIPEFGMTKDVVNIFCASSYWQE
jgi:hypothetical protein